jgi:molybdate/tungstate transport system substrate-binding protein
MQVNRHALPGRPGISGAVVTGLVAAVVLVAAVASSLYLHGGPPSASGAPAQTARGPLLLFVADAYTAEGGSLLQAFSSQTGVAVAPPKSAGSTVLGQQISQGAPVSVFISVSRTAVQPTVLNGESSGWAIGFASDQMALAYSNASLRSAAAGAVVATFNRAAASNSTAEWSAFFNALTSGSVKVGISNPDADPAGFRGWLVLEAAGGAYAGSPTAFSHRLMANSGNVTGSSAANLVAPLEAGQIQFLFIYRSAAMAQKLHYLQLPGEVNLGDPSKAAFYSGFTYPTSTGTQKGSPIVLYVTVPRHGTDQTDALSFVSFVLHNGQTLLGGYGLTVFQQATLYNDTAVPGQVAQLLVTGLLGEGGPL